jgi:transcriptional regulator with XRE-family HTH domain
VTDPSNRRLDFADRLRQTRKAKMTATRFAAAAGWQASKVSRIETGQSMIT